jgi:cytochrome bd ubiquinol oxidase subunit II
MGLDTFWFCLIAVLWSGYFVLEGFDFGVGMLQLFVPHNERERGVLFRSVGPVWDGNEVWLVVAAAATFAAFPTWYATMFSGFYVALLAILVLLIVRVVSFEWRERGDGDRWRRTWSVVHAGASLMIPFAWGVALASLLHGVPLASDGTFTGGVSDLISPYSIFAGATLALLSLFHGATFLTLRLTGGLQSRLNDVCRALSWPAGGAGCALAVWTLVEAIDRNNKDAFPTLLPAALAVAALALAVASARKLRTGRAFLATAGGIVLLVATLFTGLYPRVLVSAPNLGNSLTLANSASAHYALAVMTVAAVLLLPVVLIYQGWTYRVLRARLAGEEIDPGIVAPQPPPEPG